MPAEVSPNALRRVWERLKPKVLIYTLRSLEAIVVLVLGWTMVSSGNRITNLAQTVNRFQNLDAKRYALLVRTRLDEIEKITRMHGQSFELELSRSSPDSPIPEGHIYEVLERSTFDLDSLVYGRCVTIEDAFLDRIERVDNKLTRFAAYVHYCQPHHDSLQDAQADEVLGCPDHTDAKKPEFLKGRSREQGVCAADLALLDETYAFDEMRRDGENPLPWEWYAPIKKDPTLHWQGRWTKPYIDEGGTNELMITFSVPLFVGPADSARRAAASIGKPGAPSNRSQKLFAGIVTTDVVFSTVLDLALGLQAKDSRLLRLTRGSPNNTPRSIVILHGKGAGARFRDEAKPFSILYYNDFRVSVQRSPELGRQTLSEFFGGSEHPGLLRLVKKIQVEGIKSGIYGTQGFPTKSTTSASLARIESSLGTDSDWTLVLFSNIDSVNPSNASLVLFALGLAVFMELALSMRRSDETGASREGE